MASYEAHDSISVAVEHRVILYNERTNPLFDGPGNELAQRVGTADPQGAHLSLQHARRRLKVFRPILRIRISSVEERANDGRRWHQLGQQFQPFRDQ
jgi:hypothetical protein